MSRSDIAFVTHSTDLPGPRVRRSRNHRLVDILAIAVCGTACGAGPFKSPAPTGPSATG